MSVDFRITKMAPQDTNIAPQNVKMEFPGVPKSCFFMFSNAFHTSHQMHVDRGPAAEGVALKIRRTPRRGAAGRDGIATEYYR